MLSVYDSDAEEPRDNNGQLTSASEVSGASASEFSGADSSHSDASVETSGEPGAASIAALTLEGLQAEVDPEAVLQRCTKRQLLHLTKEHGWKSSARSKKQELVKTVVRQLHAAPVGPAAAPTAEVADLLVQIKTGGEEQFRTMQVEKTLQGPCRRGPC